MSMLGFQPFANLYRSLPVQAQKRLQETARGYVKALDRAIAEVLSPVAGRSGDLFLVADEIIPLYGVGPTPEAAAADYRSVVVEYYESLQEDAGELADVLREQLEVLRQVLALAERIA